MGSVRTSSGAAFSESVLARFSRQSLSDLPLSAAQAQVDGVVSHFVEEATDGKNLAALATGSLFYRFGRLGTLALAARAPQAAPLLRVASYGIGLAFEVTAYQGVNDILFPVPGAATASLQRSYWDRWRTNFVQFSLLKGAGAFASGHNLLLQHALQDTAMVAGNQLTARLAWTPAPTGSLAEQFLHAEATSLQMAAGMSLLQMTTPAFHAFERSLDLSIRSRSDVFPLQASEGIFTENALSPQYAGGGEVSERPPLIQEIKDPMPVTVLQMTMGDGPPGSRGKGFFASLGQQVMADRATKGDAASFQTLLEQARGGDESAIFFLSQAAVAEVSYLNDLVVRLSAAEALVLGTPPATDPTYRLLRNPLFDLSALRERAESDPGVLRVVELLSELGNPSAQEMVPRLNMENYGKMARSSAQLIATLEYLALKKNRSAFRALEQEELISKDELVKIRVHLEMEDPLEQKCFERVEEFEALSDRQKNDFMQEVEEVWQGLTRAEQLDHLVNTAKSGYMLVPNVIPETFIEEIAQKRGYAIKPLPPRGPLLGEDDESPEN